MRLTDRRQIVLFQSQHRQLASWPETTSMQATMSEYTRRYMEQTAIGCDADAGLRQQTAPWASQYSRAAENNRCQYSERHDTVTPPTA